MTPHDVLKKYWGYDSFRPRQLDIINSIMSGCDTLGLMPTGGGKSITFQVPAMLLPGITIVVTPLISLMKDQVDNLKKIKIKAGALYSGMTGRERNLVYDRARLGKLKLLYVSPERLRSDTFRFEMRTWNVSLIVIDEAHCISQWGYDFRPSYLQIGVLRDTFPGVPMLALTASATPVVQKDITEQLRFRDGYNMISLSFHRNNLSYVIRYEQVKEVKLIESLSAVEGSAIVYVRSRTATAKIADALNEVGIDATYYHAGLDPKVKEERQQLWKEDKVRVMVATNAFGMGIDKPDVRIVVHMDIPPSLEEYYQEAGRAGRDGKHSYALLIASVRDRAILTRRVNSAFPPREYIADVYNKMCVSMDIPVGEGFGHVYEFDLTNFCKIFNLDNEKVKGAINILSNAGYMEYIDDPRSRASVQILINREEFYYLNLPPVEQRVINSILRLYPGLFADYVFIDEEQIAETEHLTRQEVYDSLLSLSRKKIIHYIPKRLLPYVYMTTSRELPQYLTIPQSVYEDRRRLMEQRVDAIRQFVFGSERCRDSVLLEYFGEYDAPKCGMCDICVDHKRKEEAETKSKDEYDEERRALSAHILSCISKYPGVSLDDFRRAMGLRYNETIDILAELEESKQIYRTGSAFYISKK